MDFTKELPKKYKRDFAYSYALGPFPTFELLNNASKRALCVFIDESFNEREKLTFLCESKNVPFVFSKKALARISSKDICYAAAAFEKTSSPLEDGTAHIVLVNPADMGNLGTIIRTALGFGIKDIAVISPAADFHDPKVVRASMGAIFRTRIDCFSSFEEYLRGFPGRDIFPFMLDGGNILTPESCPKSERYSLVFGNEASGLPASFGKYGKSVFIPQSKEVDSLNLSVSVAIGAYVFTHSNPAD